MLAKITAPAARAVLLILAVVLGGWSLAEAPLSATVAASPAAVAPSPGVESPPVVPGPQMAVQQPGYVDAPIVALAAPAAAAGRYTVTTTSYEPCPEEDSPGPCWWDAHARGNGTGQSFIADRRDRVHPVGSVTRQRSGAVTLYLAGQSVHLVPVRASGARA